ncbi:MAG: hypothetical protein LBU30_06120 [Candidatus Methanoplasma sp.]|jgi:hypothetical protein|nr:hypothetical protein [Candidatus Methanoplasma sp.]
MRLRDTDLNPLNSIPRFSDPAAQRQRNLTFVLSGAAVATALVLALYGLFFVSRGSGYLIAMIAWLPIFSTFLPSGLYSYRIQKMADNREDVKEFSSAAFRISIAVAAVMIAIIIAPSVYLLHLI